MELRKFELQVVHRIPSEIAQGILYVCFDCNVVVHLCACGCGEKVILPISPDFWSVIYDGENISLNPSIGNFQFSCRSHYWIKDNCVIWENDCITPSKQKKKYRQKKKRLLDKFKTLF